MPPSASLCQTQSSLVRQGVANTSLPCARGGGSSQAGGGVVVKFLRSCPIIPLASSQQPLSRLRRQLPLHRGASCGRFPCLPLMRVPQGSLSCRFAAIHLQVAKSFDFCRRERPKNIQQTQTEECDSAFLRFSMLKHLCFCFRLDLAMLRFKGFDALPNKVQYLPVCGPPLILGNIMQFSMQLWVYFNPQMLIVLVSQTIPP